MRIRPAFLLFMATWAHAAAPAEARWEGTIQVPGRELTVVIDLAQDADGKWAGSVTFPALSVKGTALADIQVTGSELRFAVKGALGDPSFHGRTDGTSFNGEFLMGGNTAPFQLQKTGAAQVDPPRVGTAVTSELEGVWQGEFMRNGYALITTIQLSNHPGAPATAQFRVVGKRDTNIPVERVAQDGDWVTINAAPQYQIVFEGQFRKATGEIAGTFRQGPEEIPLNLHRLKGSAQ
ncbi:MAG TPA: hypothetical protein VLY24_27375 [Bryobacteraceae bacterium]|nr:hypothetical protein [Bryobacteraceae bacterium]